jgi:hypothetical protein
VNNILNITNGDCAVGVMQQAGISGVFLPWRDVLHDGPVPQGLSLEQLSEVRAQFIIDQGWGEPQYIKQSFIDRDNTLKSFENYDKVILWFEHDLYDQLQILQILDWFHSHTQSKQSLSIICVDRYLGRLSPEEMLTLVEYEEPITESHLKLANKAWSAFRSTEPESWFALLETDTSALPFLQGAILRMLEEYPACSNGLTRTARHALNIVQNGEKNPENIFARYQETEERIFLGDSSFWALLNEMLVSSPALLTLSEGKVLDLAPKPGDEIDVSAAGVDVLSGKGNWLDIVELDKWIGGVHLSSANIWCWDSESNVLLNKT